MTRRLLHRFRLADEQGVAIVLAVVIIAIITIAAASAIFYTDGSQRDAFSKKSGQTAYSLAQAAVSNAIAELLPHYYDDTGQPYDNVSDFATMSGWAPGASGSDPSGCNTTSPSPSCTEWQSELCPAGVCPDGYTASTNDITLAVWHITGKGAVYNPSGAQPIVRTITVDVPLDQPPAKVGAPDIMKSVYVGKASNGCDLSTGQNVVFAAPVYVLGNMCIGQNSGVERDAANTAKLVVGGWLELSGNGAHVGTSSAPVSSLAVGGVCTTSSQVPPPSGSACATTLTYSGGQWTGAGGTIHVSSASAAPTFPSPPDVKFLTNPGQVSCSGQDLAPAGGTFVLNTGTPYSCTITNGSFPVGSLSWDPGQTKLTIKGNVYINGNIVTNPATATSPGPQMSYEGLGTIYATGYGSFANNTAICALQTDPTGHDCPYQAAWPGVDSGDNLLFIATKGDMSGGQSNSNFSIEGGLYSDQNINFGSGHTNIYGPIVTKDTLVPGQQSASAFPDILDLFTGLPGTPQGFWVLDLPKNGTY